jgi:hypothetical protein
VQYTRAYDQSKNPRVLFNVGVCEKNLQHYARAVSRWKQQLTEAEGKLSDDEEKAVRAAIDAVQPYVSTLEVVANEPGATLLVNQEQVGETPLLGPIPIDVGRHSLTLRKDGFQDQTIEVTVATGKPEKVTFNLEPAVKKVAVTVQVSGPSGATVAIDGVEMGAAPYKGEVIAGRHTFEARARGYVTARHSSDVLYQRPLELALSLSPERHNGRVRVEVSQPDATIEVDGKVVGSGAWQGVLPSGGHQLVVRKPGFQTYSTDLGLSDDQVRNVTVPMVREKSTAWVWWTAGAVAVVAGGAVATYFVSRPAEQTPVSGTLTPGLVTARAPWGGR